MDRDDLKAAVAAGIVNEAQAARLASLVDARRGARENLEPGDEPFELFKGFNEIFIVVGLVILAMGWSTVGTFLISFRQGDVMGQVVTACAVTAAVIWALSEYFIRRRRMVAPAITLSIFWAGTAVAGFTAALSEIFMVVGYADLSSLPRPLALSAVAILLYWWRFRVPFAMAMIALAVFAVAFVWTATRAGVPQELSDLFLLSGDGPFAWVTLAVGFLVFAVAMWFDMSDPHRVTRRAAQGFWLHVIAAPALVNTIALSLLQQNTNIASLALAIVLFGFAIVAIIIDRRSFLIAAVGYCVVLSSTVFEENAAGYTILILGAALVFLGAAWERLRARLMAVLPGFVPRHRLPPTA